MKGPEILGHRETARTGTRSSGCTLPPGLVRTSPDGPSAWRRVSPGRSHPEGQSAPGSRKVCWLTGRVCNRRGPAAEETPAGREAAPGSDGTGPLQGQGRGHHWEPLQGMCFQRGSLGPGRALGREGGGRPLPGCLQSPRGCPLLASPSFPVPTRPACRTRPLCCPFLGCQGGSALALRVTADGCPAVRCSRLLLLALRSCTGHAGSSCHRRRPWEYATRSHLWDRAELSPQWTLR